MNPYGLILACILFSLFVTWGLIKLTDHEEDE